MGFETNRLKGASLTSSTKGVIFGELPHPSKELGEPTTEDGHTKDDIGVVDATDMDVEHRQHECGRREGEQSAG